MISCLRSQIGLILACFVAVGCSNKTPNPASSNIQMGPHDEFANRVLTDSEARQVVATLKEAVDGPADDPARPAEYGVRWEDVQLAARRAGGQLELAILSIDELDDGDTKRIKMISIGDTPVELFVYRKPPPKIYVVSANAGLFDDETALATDLISRFNESMRLYGAKPSWPPLQNE